jgi:cytochrome b561
MNQQTTSRYDPLSRVFHWATAILVIVAFVLGPEHFGRLIKQGVDPATHSDIVWHESLGATIFMLTLLRLSWVAFRPAAPHFDMPAMMQLAAKLAHLVLWALLFILPITALMALGSEGHPLTLLGGIRVDKVPIVLGTAIAQIADWGDVHKFAGDVIIWLAGLHAVAAIYHHVFLKDGVLLSMMPNGKHQAL